MKAGSTVATPRAVAFSSSSSWSSPCSDAEETGADGLTPSEECCSKASFELVIIRSDSLSLSSYSSWLLPVVLVDRICGPWGSDTVLVKRRLLRGSCCGRKAGGTTSSVAADEREDEEGREATSIQDSANHVNEYMLSMSAGLIDVACMQVVVDWGKLDSLDRWPSC